MTEQAGMAAVLAIASIFGAHELQGSVQANGGASRAAGGDYELSGTIAEPVAGRTAQGALVLDGGFWRPAPAAAGEAIFSNGFED